MPIGFSHHRNASGEVFGDSILANLTVIPAGVEVKAGAEPLPERHTIYIINSTSNLVYLGTEADFDTTESIIIFSGEAISISINPHPAPPETPKLFYAKVEENFAVIRVMEVK